jgi:hypothetical protein
MREELRKRLVEEYRYALSKMEKENNLARKLFYFSVFYGEAQRTLNWEWDNDIALIYTLTQHVHAQINGTLKLPDLAALPIDWKIVFDKLTQAASELTTYIENSENIKDKEELFKTLAVLSKIAYVISGNGSYLYEKGVFTL